MSTPDATLDELLAAVRRLEAKVDKLTRPAPRHGSRQVLSVAAAARMLGIDYKTTAREMLADGRLRAVPVAGRMKVPVEEVERILAEGTLPAPQGRRRPGPRRRSRPTAPLAADLAVPLPKR